MLAAAGRHADAIEPMRGAWEEEAKRWERAVLLMAGQDIRTVTQVGIRWDAALSLAAQTPRPNTRATALAADVILSGKGLLQEMLARRQAWILTAKDPAIKKAFALVQEYNADVARRNLSEAELRAQGLASPDNQRLATHAALAAEALENELAKGAVDAGDVRAAVGLTQVAAALVKGTALVEFARYRAIRFDPAKPVNRIGDWHYLAVVVRGGAAAGVADASLVPLGPAKDIEDAVGAFRKAVGRPDSPKDEIDRTGSALARLIWQPIAAELGPCRKVYLSPDGTLAFVSFAALPSQPAGHFLIDDFDLAMVATGRDLLRAGKVSDEPALVIGDPDFGKADPASPKPALPRPMQPGNPDAPLLAARAAAVSFQQLPWARREAQSVMELLQAAKLKPALLTGAAATEAAVQSARHPSMLHLATHGYFLPDPEAQAELAEPAGAEARGVGGLRPINQEPPLTRRETNLWQKLQLQGPMQRSGIALAGANLTIADHSRAGGNDGLLTADEIMRMDLLGTRLVVISACESGLGDVSSGEGVYGLRRAFVVAGVHHLVMSLWSVDDKAAVTVMGDLYRNLAAGMPPERALLAGQRQFIASQREARQYPHPFLWSAFIASGIGTGLDQK